MIKITDLTVNVWDKEIIKWINLTFETWKNYCLLWKNGSWKSTLSSVLMWNPEYSVVKGSITIWKKDLLSMSPEERSLEWIFLSFQNVPEIKGIRLSEYLRTIYNISLKNKKPDITELTPFVFKRFIKQYLEDLKIDEKFLERDLNVWFSWWEKRKIEILQMKLIWPRYIILDEIDSWLDLDAFKSVATLLKKISSKDNTLIIITHYFTILDYIDVDKVYVMKEWKLLEEWGNELIEDIKKNGYK